MREPLKILFKFPCRGRETMFFESLNSLNNNIRDRDNYHISLTLDEDDLVLNRPEVKEVLASYPNVSVEWGLSKSKVHAFNRNMPDCEWDMIIAWSQDMVATMYGFDDIIRQYAYEINNKHGDDFLLHIPEPDSMDYLNVLYIATYNYWKRFGYIYHDSYKSLWCDNESYSVAKLLNRYHYVGVLGLYIHKNAAYTKYGVSRDPLFDTQQGHWQEDEANFNVRKERNFDLHLVTDMPQFKAE